LTQARKLYDNRQYTPPPRRDLSHLFSTIPGMNLLKKHGMAMPNFVTGGYERRGAEPPTPSTRPKPTSIVDRGHLGRPSFESEAGSYLRPTEPDRGFGQQDAMRQWDYSTNFEGDMLDDLIRRSGGAAGAGGGNFYGQPFYLR